MGTRRSLPVAIGLAALLGMVSTAGPVPTSVETPQTAQKPQAAPAVELPNRPGSLKFGVIGDFGNGSRQQTELGAQMTKLRARFPFEFVITVGDNIYGGDRPQDMRKKFELPYKALLDGGVKFYASLGNHDDRGTSPLRIVQHGRPDVLHVQGADGGRPVLCPRDRLPERAAGGLAREGARELERATGRSRTSTIRSTRPASATGRTRTWPRCSNRSSSRPASASCSLATIISTSGRSRRQGIVHFVIGSGGQLRKGDIDRRTGLTAVGFDTDQAFLVAEIDGDQLYFNAISRLGTVIDSGVIERRKPGIGSSASAASRAAATGGWLAAQSASNTPAIFFAAAGLLTMTPTSRRPSSSSLRRLWLPTKNAAPSRMIARTCSRRSASFRVSTAASPLSTLPMMRISTPALLPLLERTQHHPIRHLGRCRSAAAFSRR